MTEPLDRKQRYPLGLLPADLNRDIPLSDNAMTVLRKRYLLRGPDGEPSETPAEMFWRVASVVAAPDAVYGDDAQATARAFYEMLTSFRFMPNSPTFTGAGTPLGQLAACFVLPIKDDMGRDPAGIFSTLRVAALIQQTGGGNGFSFSRLRPKGARVSSSRGVATGPVGFLRVYDKAFGEIAQGGCLLPETLVFTGEGLLRLDEMIDPRQPGWQPHSLEVATDEGWRPSPHGYNNGVKPVLRVQTRQGLTLTGTPDHKVKVMTPAGPAWRPLRELQAGDSLIVQLGQHRGRLRALRKPTLRHGNQIEPNLPPILDEELAFFLGYLAGDGFVAGGETDYRLGVTVAHDSYLMEEMPRLMARLFGVQVHATGKPGDNSTTFFVDNRAVKEFLILNGLVKSSSRSVHVPRLIRTSPPEIVAVYLRGLFEADGTVSHGYPSLITTSARLAEEAATLLIGLGCPIGLRRRPAGKGHWGDAAMYEVRIRSHVGLRAWQQRIGCDPRSRFAVCMAWEPDLDRESSYPLPHAGYWLQPVLEAITLPQVDKRGRGQGRKWRSTEPRLRRQLLRYLRQERALTHSAYQTLAETHPLFAAHAPEVDDLWFVEVEGVEPAGEALTLDLEVEGNHTYLAYGLVTHNTRRGANMAVLRVDHPDILEFIRCKGEEGDITNFNISVGITDEFMRAVEADEEYDLINPQDGTVWKRLRAREVFDEIVRHAHRNGEPGVLFLDTANRSNPVPHLYELEATNPCVTGDTLVATPQGWRRADSIQVGDAIHTVSGTGRVATVEINHNMPVYRVHFADGGSVRATASHQFHVWDPAAGAFAPRRLDQLKAGDQVRVHHSNPGSTNGKRAVEVMDIEPAGVETVYDLYEPRTDTWITEGYVSRGCGEQWLGDYENCCLGSVNLARHAAPEGGVDWAKLRETVELATRFLDNVVDANKYVPAVPEIEAAARRARRIGLGIMGLGDLMFHGGIRYGSPEGEEFAAQVMEFVRFHAMRTSIELARERGAFPAIGGSIYDPEDLKWRPPTPLTPYSRDFGRPPLDWGEIVRGIEAYGIRNAATATVAPTGTIATVSGCEAYGCEPTFALSYVRHFKDGDRDVELTYTSPLFIQALERAGLDEETRQRIIEQVSVTGSCQAIAQVPEEVRHTFVVASDITAEEHVRMQAAIQAFVDNSISKCVTGDTLVLTGNGLTAIRELGDMRLPDQFAPLDVPILSPAGRERTDSFYYGGRRETRRVSVEYGFEIEGTPNHRIHVLDGNGQVVFRRLDEIQPGDTVVLYTGHEAFGPPDAPLPPFSGQFRTSSRKITFPTHMSQDLAFFLGAVTSEGAITVNGLNITNTNRALLEELQAIALRLWGARGRISKDRRNEVHYLQINSRPLRHWLLHDLGLQAGAAHKIIPACILSAGREEIVAFLRGLSLDSYMTADGKLFGITLASARLIYQLQALLLNFGVLATVRQTAQRAWNLVVQGGELERLAEIARFVDLWKSERIERRNEGRQQRYRNYSRLLPASITTALREMQNRSKSSLRSRYQVQQPVESQAYQRVRVNLLQNHRLERGDAVRLYRALQAEGIHHPLADAFFAQDDERRVYVQVQSIESGFSEVFDISVPGSHSFIANGFGNHNTVNFPEDAAESDVARAYQLAWRLGCKGLTVYVTGSREKVVLETKKTKAAKQGAVQVEPRRPRPTELRGTTYRTPTPLGTAYITINENGHHDPFEVFANVGKAGSDTAAVAEAIGRLISLILRMPSPLDAQERLTEVIDQLSGIGGRRPLGFGPNRVRSLPDAIAQVLARHIAHVEAEPPPEQLPLPISLPDSQADLCPECGQASYVAMEGCRKCLNCGYSEC